MLTGGLDGSSANFLNAALLYPEGCSVPSMKTDRYSHVSFLTQDVPPHIAVCGGGTRDCLVLQSGQWREGILDNLPEIRTQAAAARLDAGVYILGGRLVGEKTSLTSVFLRANSSSWVSGPELPVSMLYGPCAAPISAHSFLVVYEFDVWEFDTRVAGLTSSAGFKERGRWPRLSMKRHFPGCAVVNNKLIVAGGQQVTTWSTEIIDLERRSITRGGDMTKPRYSFHLLSIRGNIFAVGGEYFDGSHSLLADVEEFVEESGSWKLAESLPGKRTQFGAVAVNKGLLCG